MKIKFITDILNWISGAAKKVKEALNFGKETANAVKTIVDSPLLDVVVSLTKTTVDNSALFFLRVNLPIWLEKMGWAEKKVSDFDETTLPHVLNAINAEAAKLYADHKQIELSRPQAIAGAQVNYNPEIVKGEKGE